MKFLQRLQRGLSFMNKREKGYIYIFTIILISLLAIFFTLSILIFLIQLILAKID